MTDTTTDTKQAVLDWLTAQGGEYKAVFVPRSQSRNAEEENPMINWRVTFSKGRSKLTTDYGQGLAHLPGGYKHSRLLIDHKAALEAVETGLYCPAEQWKTKRVVAPHACDVLYSLVMDASAIDAGTFENWASEYGYDVDSRKAEETYRACIDIGLKLRSMFGDVALSELRDMLQDY